MVVGALSVNAQYTLTHDGTDYDLIQSWFSPVQETPITAEIGAIMNPCENMADMTGKVAMYRFENTCHPAVTAELAEQAGASAVIVCGIFSRSTGNLFFPDATGTDVQIPSFTMDPDACLEIIAAGGNVTVGPKCKDAVPANAVWGSNGEGTFNGGLNDWTIIGDGLTYEPQSIINRGTYYNGPPQASSPTACNGMVVGNSDFLNESGACLSSATSPCIGELESPVIDLSGVESQGLAVQFHQTLRQFRSNYKILYSLDGGMNYDTIHGNRTTEVAGFNSHVVINDPVTTETKTVALCMNAGQDLSNFRIKIRYEGYYYFWAIDDVYIVNDPGQDVQLGPWASGVINYATPAGNGDVIALMADINNQKGEDANNVVLTARMLSGEDVIQEKSFDYNTVQGCNSITSENKLFPETMTLPETTGDYRLVYNVSSDNDVNDDNNTRVRRFVVTENFFSKLPHAEIEYYWSPRDPGFYSMGNVYYVGNNKDADGNPYILDQLNVAIGSTGSDFVSGSVDVSVYEWIDLNGDGQINPVGEGDVPERTLLAKKSIAFLGEDAQYENYFVDFSDENIELKENTFYLCVLHSAPLNSGTESHRFGVSEDELYDYSPTVYAFGNEVEVSGEPLNLTRLSTVVSNIESSADNNDTRELFSATSRTLFLDMYIKKSTNTEEINENIGVSVFPNPATTNIVVDLALESVSDNVNLQFIDAQGRVVKSVDFSDVINDKLNVNVEDLATGVYMINIRTAEGMTSTRFIKG